MTGPVPAADLSRLTPAAEEGWHLLFDLTEERRWSWLLVGGQMVYLLAVEHGVHPPRSTDDVDVVIDVRAQPGGTEEFAGWLLRRGFSIDGVSADNIAHRFTKPAEPGPGTVVVDVLAPEGLSERTNLFTRRPGRTVQAPGTVQALKRSELVTVRVSGEVGRPPRTGQVRRPNVLAALIAKAAATKLAVRTHPERDWADAALLLALIGDPIAAAGGCDAGDRRRLRGLAALSTADHPAWALLPADFMIRGREALAFLLR